MSPVARLLVVSLLGSLCAAVVQAQQAPATQVAPARPHGWWNQPYPRRPRELPDGRKLPLIRVKGNRFVDPEGKPVLFRGVSISDPDKIEAQGHWNKAHFEHVKALGAMIVRIPVHPIAWRVRTPPEYLELLNQGVQWCTELGIYVIIEWHSIGNLRMELFESPIYDTTQRETYEFWRTIARHFKANNTVAFYELFNEPTTYRGQLGAISWTEWKKMNEDMIGLIRAYDDGTIPLVAGFDWAYDLTPILVEPVNAEGIGYVTHPYANKRPPPWEPKWEENFGFAAERYPVLATEIGFGLRGDETVGDDHYGNLITRYLERKGIGWLAWVYDPEWYPRMLNSWDYDLTGSGEFFKLALHREAAGKK